MNNKNKYIYIGVGILALLGIGVYAMAASKKRQALLDSQKQQLNPQNVAPEKPTIVDVAGKAIDKLIGSPEVAQQRIQNRRVRQSTRQAKLLKKGKIRIEDLSALQKV